MARFTKTVTTVALTASVAAIGLGVASVQPASAAQADTAAQAPPRCHTQDLAAIFTQIEGAAGNIYMKVRLTNTSLGTCAIYGYGGLELVGPDPAKPGVPPTHLLRDLSPGPSLVVLAPGQAADKQLHYSQVPHPGDNQTGPCQVRPVRALITPPDETTSLTVDWPSGSVCNQGTIDGSAYFRAG
ncbi:MAG: DUF4232 domain-containing protein [Pseudonocardiaceae bacterium]